MSFNTNIKTLPDGLFFIGKKFKGGYELKNKFLHELKEEINVRGKRVNTERMLSIFYDNPADKTKQKLESFHAFESVGNNKFGDENFEIIELQPGDYASVDYNEETKIDLAAAKLNGFKTDKNLRTNEVLYFITEYYDGKPVFFILEKIRE